MIKTKQESKSFASAFTEPVHEHSIVQIISITLVSLIALMFIWPNFIHEPLHYGVLKAYGIDGYISFDFTPPISPTTTHTEPITTVTQGMIFRLAPSLFSVILIVLAYLTRRRAAFITHILIPVYLTFDLIINILGYEQSYNDFIFLQVLHPAIPFAAAATVGVAAYHAINAIINEFEERINNDN